MNSSKLLAFALLVGVAQAQDFKPCDSTVSFIDRNMIGYSVTVRRLQGSVLDPTGVAVPKDCIALFASDHSRLLRTIEANENGQFAIHNVKPGDYWLVVQDPQRVFCPATTLLKLRPFSRKSKIVVHMAGAGIDRCSYCESR